MVASLAEVIDRIRTGNCDGRDELRQILASAPNDPDVIGNLAFIEASRGEHKAAIRHYLLYLRVCPQDHPEPHWRIGDRLVRLGRLERAERVYRGVLDRWPDCEDALFGNRYIAYLRSPKAEQNRKPGLPATAGNTLRDDNAELNKREMRENREVLESLPTAVHIESTTKCNFACRTCSKGHEAYYAEDLKPEVFERFQSEILPTTRRIAITGFGEPTYSRMFDKLMEAAEVNQSVAHFVTNGSLLDFARIESIVRQDVEVTISVDGATRETFEYIRTGSSFPLICEKLGMLKKVRDVLLCEARAKVAFNFVALRRNLPELAAVVRMAHRYAVDFVGVADYNLRYTDFDPEAARFAPVEANRAIDEAQRVARELGIKLDTPPPYDETPPPPPNAAIWSKLRNVHGIFPAKNRFPRKCHSPWSEPYIMTDGTVTPCCANSTVLGNIREQSFREIWNGPAYRSLRRRISGPLPPLLCRLCFVCWGINGGNAGNVIAKEGLLVKIWYFLEFRWMLWRQRHARKHEAVPPAPNFEKGRPIRKRVSAEGTTCANDQEPI